MKDVACLTNSYKQSFVFIHVLKRVSSGTLLLLSLVALASAESQPVETTKMGPGDVDQRATPVKTAPSDAATAEVLQELSRMRARIEELEAQLKQRSEASAAAGTPAPVEAEKLVSSV